MNMLTNPSHRNHSESIVFWVIFFFMLVVGSIFIGLISATGWGLFITIGLGLCGMALLVVVSLYIQWSLLHILFFGIMLCFFLADMVQNRIGLPLASLWQLSVLVLGGLGLLALTAKLKESKLLTISFLFFFLFLLLLAISTALKSFNIKAAGFQFLSDLKFPALICFGIFWAGKVNVEKFINRFSWPYVIIVFSFLMLQWIFPSIYKVILNVYVIPVETTAIFPSLGLSIFHHPSILAGISAVLAIYYFSKFLIFRDNERLSSMLKFIFLVFLVLSSNQRQEIFALLIIISLIYIFKEREFIFRRIAGAFVLLTVFLVVFISAYSATFIKEMDEWGMSSYKVSTHPRAQLYEGANYLAKVNFPFGSGLGSFGGVGSLKYDLTQYYKLGYSTQWWWRDYEGFLLDTYWPNSLAEAGYFGALFLLLHYLIFGLYLIKNTYHQTDASRRFIWLVSTGSFLWVVLVTPTSPGFQEVLILYLPSLFIGAAFRSQPVSENPSTRY